MTALSRKKDTYLAHTGNHERNMDNGEIDDNLMLTLFALPLSLWYQKKKGYITHNIAQTDIKK